MLVPTCNSSVDFELDVVWNRVASCHYLLGIDKVVSFYIR
jgi:hypothetical protein